MRPVLSTEPTSEAALVREQGGWVLAGSIGSAVLGFVFWGLAARLFSANAVGIAGSIVGLSSLATSIGILGLDNGLVRYAPRASRPRALMWRILLVGGGLASVVGLVLSLVVLTVSNDLAVLQILPALVVIAVVQTTSQTCFQITDASILAARKSEYLAYRAVSYGIAKIVLLFALLPAGVVGLSAAYTLPLLVPMVALGVVLAQVAMTILGGTQYGAHSLALQLFLLATLPKAGIQIYKAQFNVDRRPLALIVLGGTLGISTVAFFLVGLLLRVNPDWLPLAWVLGGALALAVGWSLSRRKAPSEPEPQPAVTESSGPPA